MLKVLIFPAILTGIFCAGFAVFIDTLTTMLERDQIIAFSFASGFLGSVFARLVLSRWKSE